MNEDKMRKAFVAYATSGENHIKAGLSWDSVEVRNASEAFRAGWQAATRAAVPAWQPIETAPRHGRDLILLLTPSKFPQVAYSNSWHTCGFSVECKPTHYMPIPPSPEVKP